MATSWQDLLDNASSVHDVVEVARDFLASWDRYEIAALPEQCRPGKIFDANDVNAYAFLLVRNDCDGEAAPLVQKMAAFFSNASARLTAILGAQSRESEEQLQSRA